MKLHRFALLAVAATGLAACSEDEGPITPPAVPLAYVRYVHAIPDTGAVDFRMIDQLENSLNVVDGQYRSISPYQGVEAGKGRKIRVFGRGTAAVPVVGPSIDDVQKILVDTTLTFDANKYYTILHTGFARAGGTPRQRLVVVEDVKPTPGANQLAVRVFHLGPTAGSVDLYATATATAPLTTPLASNVAYLANTGYRTLATGPLVLRATDAGGTTQLASGTAPAGSAATGAQTAIAGSSISGSALSAFVFQAGVGNNAAVTTPSIVYMQDNRP